MADGRQRSDWGRMSSLMALIANVNRDPKKKRQPYKPRDFDPWQGEDGKKNKPPQIDLSVLRTVFVDGILPAEMSEKEEPCERTRRE